VSWYRVFDDGILPQACEPQPGYEPLVVALGRLAIDEQGKALLEAERCNVRLPPLLRRSGTATSARVTDHAAMNAWWLRVSWRHGKVTPWRGAKVMAALARNPMLTQQGFEVLPPIADQVGGGVQAKRYVCLSTTALSPDKAPQLSSQLRMSVCPAERSAGHVR
jgi:hypothetical protein